MEGYLHMTASIQKGAVPQIYISMKSNYASEMDLKRVEDQDKVAEYGNQGTFLTLNVTTAQIRVSEQPYNYIDCSSEESS